MSGFPSGAGSSAVRAHSRPEVPSAGHEAQAFPKNATGQNSYRGGHTIINPAPWDPNAGNIEHIDREAYRQGLGVRPVPPQPKPANTPTPQWFVDRLPQGCQDNVDFTASAGLRYQHGQLPEACTGAHQNSRRPSRERLPSGCEPDDAYEAVQRASHEEQTDLTDAELRELMWSSSNSRSAMWMGGDDLEVPRQEMRPLRRASAPAVSLPQAQAPQVESLQLPRALQASLPEPPPHDNSIAAGIAPLNLEFSFKQDLPTSPLHESGKVDFSQGRTATIKEPPSGQPSFQAKPERTDMESKKANSRSGGATILVGEGPQLAPLNFRPQLALFLQIGARGRSPVPGAYGQLRRSFSEELPKRRAGLPEDAGTSPGGRGSPGSDAGQRKEATIGAFADPHQVQLLKASKGGTLGLQQLPALPPRANATTGSGARLQDEQTSLRRTISSGNLTISSVGGRTCPVCLEENIKSSSMETFGCGIHSICTNCFMHIAVDQLAMNNIPRCPMSECKMPLESLVALRLLDKKDLDKYLMLALFSNPRYMVCPNCKENLFSEVVPPCAETARCPKCSFVFCTDCRCSPHPSMTCEEAMKKQEAELVEKGEALAEGVKACPRCMAPVYKEDDGSCDHMTCAKCKHEYCWACLADRTVIFAHGNHYHMPSCKFFAQYDGPDEYLPTRCVRCKLRGSVCRKPQVASNSSPQALFPLFDVCINWVRSAINCNATSTEKTLMISV